VKKTARRRELQRSAAPPPEPPLSPARAFVVQFREAEPGAVKQFRGRVEHMVSGDVARFEAPEELLAFFARVLGMAPEKLSTRVSNDR
jgi:hypothetical protein